jgi:hypothetical protein
MGNCVHSNKDCPVDEEGNPLHGEHQEEPDDIMDQLLARINDDQYEHNDFKEDKY